MQSGHENYQIIKAIHYFIKGPESLTYKINPEAEKVYRISLSSKKDILFILDFFEKNKLLGYKKDNSLIFNGLNRKHALTDSIKDVNLSDIIKKEIISHNSKYELYRFIISLAIIYDSVTFYLPTFMDFRGRIYSIVSYLNYQGEDFAKSILEFGRGCFIDNTNVVYVLQFLANTAGKSKLSIKNKEKWAIQFINDLNVLPKKLDLKNLDLNMENNTQNEISLDYL